MKSVEMRSGEGATADRFWQLYSESAPYVHGFFAKRCPTHVAEDLTQEVFVDLARRARRGDDLDGLTVGWLITVARSRLIDHVRAEQRRERKLSLAWSAAVTGDRGVEADAGSGPAELGAATVRALEALSAVERYVLVLHHLDGMSIAEVAEIIGRTTRATDSLLSRARRKFRAAFEEGSG